MTRVNPHNGFAVDNSTINIVLLLLLLLLLLSLQQSGVVYAQLNNVTAPYLWIGLCGVRVIRRIVVFFCFQSSST